MSIPQIVAVAIGLIVTYYLLGLFVSYFTDRAKELLETRGMALQDYLLQIVGDKKLNDLLAQPQIKSLAPIRYKNALGFFTGVVEPKTIEKIPVSNLVEGFFNMCGGLSKEFDAEQVKGLIASLPDGSEAKTALQDLVDKKVQDVNQVRTRITMWFSGLMDQANDTYKAQARRIVVALSLIVTLFFAMDSIDLAQQFWNNANLQAAANVQASIITKEQNAAPQSLDQILAELQKLNIKFGWGYLASTIPANPVQIPGWVLLRILGLGITTVAVSQGSSFWYDLLRNITGQAGSTPAPSSSDSGASG